jgi:hypothetical protein
MEYLIITTDGKLCVQDWTPFNNKRKVLNSEIPFFMKGDKITNALKSLSLERWSLNSQFTKGKCIYFIIQRNISNIQENNSSKC